MNESHAFESLSRREVVDGIAACCRIVFVIVLLVGAVGCDASSSAHQEHPSEIERLVMQNRTTDHDLLQRRRGFQVYQHYCQICHGEYGEGDGFNSSMLDPLPRDFSDESFWNDATDEKLAQAISSGGVAVGKTNLMPAWGNTLQSSQIDDVISYLKTVPESVKRRLESEAEDDESADGETMNDEAEEDE